MDPDLYDEFGNYIGPELESESEDSSEEEREEEEEPKDDGMDQEEEEEGGQSMAIVLHEVKYFNLSELLSVLHLITCNAFRTRSTIQQREKCLVLMLRQLSMRKILNHSQSPSLNLSERISLSMWSRSCLRQPTPWSSSPI